MKDVIITRMIPALHRNILFFLTTLFLLGFFTFIALIEGFGIERLLIGGVKIEKLYLKWNNALQINAATIDLTRLQADEGPLSLQPLAKLPRIVRWSEAWIEAIDIGAVAYKGYRASLSYRRNAPGTITFRHGESACTGSFFLDEKHFRLLLPSCSLGEGNLSGEMAIDLLRQQLKASASLALPETPAIAIMLAGDADSLRFSVQTDQNLTTIAPLVRFLGVNPKVVPWIAEYAKADALQLKRLEGDFTYDSPKGLLETLHAEATVMKGEYTFAQGIEPILAERIDLQFKKGKLFITPVGGSFYALPTEKSRLWIDFTTPDTTLTALIRTNRGRLNEDILNLLHHYRIDLPLKQTSGECAVDLNLTINLHSLKTTAVGTFIPTPSEILLGKVTLRSEGGIVRLDTRQVRFEGFDARYEGNTVRALVSGEYDAATEKGRVYVDAYQAAPLGDPEFLSLLNPRSPLRVTYTIVPGNTALSVGPSSWNLMGEVLSVDGFSAPYDYRNAALFIRSLPFRLSDGVEGEVDAQFDGAARSTDISVLLNRFAHYGATLEKAPFRLNVRYENNTTRFEAPDASAWTVHQLPVSLSPLRARLDHDGIVFEPHTAVLDDLLEGTFSGHYRPQEQRGEIRLEKITPISPNIAALIDPEASLDLSIDLQDDVIRLEIPELKARFATIPQGWQISLDDISLLSTKSPILRRYAIDRGYVNLFYTGERSLYSFDGAIDYPYALMVTDDIPLTRYRFSGSHRDGNTTIRVNNRLTISHTPQRLFARANNTGINVPELFRFLSAPDKSTIQSASSPGEPPIPVRIHANNTFLYLTKGKKIVADTLDALIFGNDLNATLRHGSGSASLAMQDGRFDISGQGFGDTFMNHLFSLGDLHGGFLSFKAGGKANGFEGEMWIEKAVLQDYVILNNVLAFINTVPSLATFSLPNYHSEGLPIEKGYAHFAYGKDLVHVDSFHLDSPEMKIIGIGSADISKRTLDGNLTLKTDLGSVLGKVPMVGYILFGDDGSISTTLSLSGKLDNPNVETAITQEIITAPFNILKRTLIYPFLWALPDEKKK